ncbi:hypothetical protein C8A01DRAFT_20660 [Parachaetomium inaequale]|uniref:Uncharacterized protein n=1 Tax=Parachaetomium inaequale TaxID=2588326 RepID=A0AAN6P7H6_9PEZI|nr:hypothetical protein C8A01DRAFT_20660 [Parachaetomium inaequale]
MRVSAQNGSSAGRSVQRPTHIPAQVPAQIPAQRRPQNGSQQSQTAVKRTTRKVVAGPGGRPVQVVETEEHVVKKTVWTRVLTGATKAAKPTMQHTGKAVKRMIPQLDRSGRNMSYYREAFWRQDEQTRWNLYMSGAAPKMNMWDVRKLHSQPRRFLNKFQLRSVMYDTHVSPKGVRVPPTDIKKKKQGAIATSTATGKAKAKAKVNANPQANPDALPFFATPETYITTHKVQVKPRPVTTARPQQHPQEQPQGQVHRPPQHAQPQTRLSTQPPPQRQSHQIGLGPQMQRSQGHQPAVSAAATRQSYPVQGGLRPASQGQAQGQARVMRQSVVVPVLGKGPTRGTGRRVAGQSVAGLSVAGSSAGSSRW